MSITWAVTDMMKKIVGRPRPNFIALAEYINNIPTASPKAINEAYQSFPSGHASLSMCGLGFLALVLAHTLGVGNVIGYVKKKEEGVNNQAYKV